jgi:hypothetical protein
MNYGMYDYCSLRDALRIDAVYEGVKKFCYGELFEDLVKKGYKNDARRITNSLVRGYFEQDIVIDSFENLRKELKQQDKFLHIRNFGNTCLYILQKEYATEPDVQVGLTKDEFIKNLPVITRQMLKIEGRDEYFTTSEQIEASIRARQLGVKLEVVVFKYKLEEE